MKYRQLFLSSRWTGRLLACAALLAAAAGTPQLRAQSALPFYEPFPGANAPAPYGNGEELGNSTTSGLVWDFGNGVSSSCARVESYAALEYPGLTNIDATSSGPSYGLSSYPKDTSSAKSRGALLGLPTATTPTLGISNTTLYASCLFSIQTNVGPSSALAFFGLSPSTNGTSVSESGAVVFFNQSGQLLISKNSSTPATNTTYSLTASNTYLVVLRYQYNTGKPDQVDLWVDPTSLGNDSSVPSPNITTTNNANVPFFGSVAYYQNALPSLIFIDEIRVATNWSGVTPTTPAPGNLYSVTGGGVGCAGASFPVGLSGSDSAASGVQYLLYTNGVMNGQIVNGTGAAVSFGLQDSTAIYTVLATNTLTSNVGWMSGSAAVTVTPAPNISQQPVSALVAANALAGFTVGSLGNGLLYQWYRNGVALTDTNEFSGSQTTNLMISPATAADVANTANGYYVKVSNPCGGYVYSTTNALTLDSPANLVWYGDGVSNLWDVAVSTNWNNNTAVFHFGDNVTFDDTSANTSVTLASPDLSPTLITVNGNGGQNYTFSGGILAGNGLLVMNSLGTLNLDIQNNETGGLIISNGAVAYGTPAALGLGVINLAGGGLLAPGNGLVTVANTINITASNSCISVNSPGGQPLVLTGPLNPLAGSLMFSNSTTKAATANLELNTTNLVFNLPVDLSPGTVSGNGLFVSGNNTSGSQVWNSMIIDGGGLWRQAAGGTTILNYTNLYSGATKLSAGNLEVGVDSISILSPPTVDAGPLGVGTFTLDTGAGPMQLIALNGARLIGNPINYASTNGGAALIIGGTNSLTLSGTIDLSSTNRVFQITNAGLTVLSGVISDNTGQGNGEVNGFSKTGNGILYLDGANAYVGDTTNFAGTLAGSGSLTGRLIVQSGATLGAGDAGTVPGTFTVGSDLLLGGNGWFRLNKLSTLSQTNDIVSVSGILTNLGTGVITVTNVNPALPLAIGDSFYLFSEAVSNGAALTVTGGGMNWNNHLAVDGGITALSVAFTTANYPTNMTFSLNNTSLTINWPATHLGWILQSQTNRLGAGLTAPSAAWYDMANTASGTSANITINPTNPTVFFRLRHP